MIFCTRMGNIAENLPHGKPYFYIVNTVIANDLVR